MEILSSEQMPIRVLAEMSLTAELYESPAWTIIQCYRDILNDPEVESTSKLILLRDEHKCVGSAFFNDKFSEFYWDTNVQMYVKPECRGNGYAKTLFMHLTNSLKSSGWDGTLYSGFGVEGSPAFWNRMNALHNENTEKYYRVVMSY